MFVCCADLQKSMRCLCVCEDLLKRVLRCVCRSSEDSVEMFV